MKPLVRSSNTKHKNNAVATAIACSILLVLPGCAIPKLRPAAAGTSLPQTSPADSFNGETSSENSAQVGTIRVFQ